MKSDKIQIVFFTSMFIVFQIFSSVAYSAPETPEALARIQQLKGAGKFTEAQEVYGLLLKDSSLSKQQFLEIQQEFEHFNMQLLFSRIEMTNSKVYTVVSGDSHYKIAKKFKTTVELLRKSNGLTRDTIYPGMRLKIVTGSFSLKIDKSDNQLKLFLNDKFVKHYDIATGKDNITPEGEFTIVNKLVNPTWFSSGAVIPPDSPKNILGTRWMGFDLAGYGIHGTTAPESIGKQASAGCIRMHNRDVEELYSILSRGTKVVITN